MLVRHAFKYVAIIIVLAGVALSHRVVDADADAVAPTPVRRPALHGHVKRHVGSGQRQLTHRRHRRKREVSHSSSGEKISGLDYVEPVLPEPHHFELSTNVAKKHHKKLKKVSTKAQIRDRVNEVNAMLFGEQIASGGSAEEAQEPSELLSRSTSKNHGKPGCKNSKAHIGDNGTNKKGTSVNHTPKASCSSTTECGEMEPAADENGRHGNMAASKSEANAPSDKLFGIYDEQSMQFVPLQMGKLSSKRDDPSPLDANVQETAYQLEQLKKLYSGYDLDCNADEGSHKECQKEASHKDVVHLARVQSDPHSRQLHLSPDNQNDGVVDLHLSSKQNRVGDSSGGEMCHLAQIRPAQKHDQHRRGQNQKHSNSAGQRAVISDVPIVIIGPKVIRSRSASDIVQSGSLVLKRSPDGNGFVERDTASISPAEQCDLLKAAQNVAQKAVLVLSNPVLLSSATSAEQSAPKAAQAEGQNAVQPRSQDETGDTGGNLVGMAEKDICGQYTQPRSNEAGMAQNDLTELKLDAPLQADSELNKPCMGQNDLAFSGTSQINSAVGNSALNKPGMSQNNICGQNTQQNNKAAMAQIDSAFAGPSKVNSAMSNSALNKPGMALNDLAFSAPSQMNSAFGSSALNKPGMSQNDLNAQTPQQLNQAGMAQNDVALSAPSQLNSPLSNSQTNMPGMSQVDLCQPSPGNKAGMAQNDLAQIGPSQINGAASSSGVSKAGIVQNGLCIPPTQPPNSAGMSQNEFAMGGPNQVNSSIVNSALNKPGMSQDDVCKPANKAGMAQNDLAMTANNQLNSNLGFYKPGMSMNDIFNPKVNKAGSGLNDLAPSAHLSNAAENSALNKPGMSQNDLCTQNPQQNSKAAMAQIDSAFGSSSPVNSAMSNSALNKPGMAQNDLCTQNPQQNSKAAMAQIDSAFGSSSPISSAMSNSALNKPGIAQNDLCTQNPQQNSKAAMAQIDSAFGSSNPVNSAMSNSALNKPGMAKNDLCAQNSQQNSKAAMAQNDICAQSPTQNLKAAMAEIDSTFAGPSQANSAVSNSALNTSGISQNDLCTQNPQQNSKAAMAQIDSTFSGPSQVNSAMSNSALNKPGMAQNDLCTQNPQQNSKAAMAQIDSTFSGPSQVNSAMSNSSLNKPGMAQNDLCTQNPQQNSKAAMAEIDSDKPGMAQKDIYTENRKQNNNAGMANKDLAANQTKLNKAGTAQNDICLRNPSELNKTGMAQNDLAVGTATNKVNNAACNATVNKPGMSKDDQFSEEFQALNDTDEVAHRLTTERAGSPCPVTTACPANKAGFGDKDVTLPDQKTPTTTASQSGEDVKYEWPSGDCNGTRDTTPSTPSVSSSTKNPVKNAQAGNAADLKEISKTKSSADANKQAPKLDANAKKPGAANPSTSKTNANKANSTKATASGLSHCENSFQTLFNATGAAVDEKQVYPEVTNKSIASAKDIAAIDKDSASRPLHTTACPSTGGYVFPEQAGSLVLPCEDRTTETPPPPPTGTTARPVRSGDSRLVLIKRHLSADQMRRHLAAVSFMKGFNGNALFPPGWVPTGAESAMAAQPAGSPTAGNPLAGNFEAAQGAETYPTGVNSVRHDNIFTDTSFAGNSKETAQEQSLAGSNNAVNAEEVSKDRGLVENEGINQQREPSPGNNVAVNQQGDANAKALPTHTASDANSPESFNSGSYSLNQFGLDDDMYVKPLPDLKPANVNAFPGALNTENAASSYLRVETQPETDASRFASISEPTRLAVSSLVGNVKSTLQARPRPNEFGNAPLLSPPQNLINLAPMAPTKQVPLPAINTAQVDADHQVFPAPAYMTASDANSASLHQLQANFNAVPSPEVAPSPEKSPAGDVSQLKIVGHVPELNAFGVKEMEKPAEPSVLDLADPFQMPIVRVDEEASLSPNAASKYSSSLQDIYLPSVNSKMSLDNVLGQPRPQEQALIQHLITTAYGDRRYLNDGVIGERRARSAHNGVVDDLNESELPNESVEYSDEISDYERLRRDIDDVRDELDEYKRSRRDIADVEDYDRLHDGVVDEFDDYDEEERDPRRVLEFLRHQAMTYGPHKRQWHHERDPYWERMYDNLGPSREDQEAGEDVERHLLPRPKPRCQEEPHVEVDERPTPPPPRMYVPPVDTNNHNFELPERIAKTRKRSIETKQHPFGERGQGDSSASEGLDRSEHDNKVERVECSTTVSAVEEGDVEPDEEEETTEKKEVNLVPEDVEEDTDDEFETDLELASPDRDEDADVSDEVEERSVEDLVEGGKNNTDKTARRARRVQTDPARPSADKVVVMVSLPADRDYDSVWQRTAPTPPPLRIGTTSTVDPFDECFESFGKTTDLAEPVTTHKVEVSSTVGNDSTIQTTSHTRNTSTQGGHNDSTSTEACTSVHVFSTSTKHSSEVTTNETKASNDTYQTLVPTTTKATELAKSTSSIENSTHNHITNHVASSTTPEHSSRESSASSKDHPKSDFGNSTTEMLKTSTCHSSTYVKSTSEPAVENDGASTHYPTTTEVSKAHKTSCLTLEHSTHTTHSTKRTSNHPHTTPHACSSARQPPLKQISKNTSTVLTTSKPTSTKSSRLLLDETSEDTTHTHTSTSNVHSNSSEPCKNSSHPSTSHETSTSLGSATPTTSPNTTVSCYSSHESSHSQHTEAEQPATATSHTTEPGCLEDFELASDQDLGDDSALEVINDQESVKATTSLPLTTSRTATNDTVASRTSETCTSETSTSETSMSETSTCDHTTTTTTTENGDMDLLVELEKLCHAAREQEARRHDKHVQHGNEKSYESRHSTEKRRKCSGTKHSSTLNKSEKDSKTDGTKHTSMLMDSIRKRFRPASHTKAAHKEVSKRRGQDHGGSLEFATVGDWNEDDEKVKTPQESLLSTLGSQLRLLPKIQTTHKRSEADDTQEVAYDDDEDLEAPTKEVVHSNSLWSPHGVQPTKKANHKRKDSNDMLLWFEG